MHAPLCRKQNINEPVLTNKSNNITFAPSNGQIITQVGISIIVFLIKLFQFYESIKPHNLLIFSILTVTVGMINDGEIEI